MAGTAAVILGHSHLSSIALQLIDRPGEVYGGDDSIQYYVFDTVRMGVDFQFSIDSGGGRFILNPIINKSVDEKIPPDRKRIYISMFGGNAHNALTLLEHPRPFDFILPDNVNLPIDRSAEFVTAEYIDAFLNRMAAVYTLNMATLKSGVPEHVVHFESPPPIGSNEFILEHLEGYFGDKANDPRIAPRWLRYKLWRMHSRLIKRYCDAIGIEFLPTPAECLDEEGFLQLKYGRDSTHASGAFGGIILKSLERRLGMKYGGWNWL